MACKIVKQTGHNFISKIMACKIVKQTGHNFISKIMACKIVKQTGHNFISKSMACKIVKLIVFYIKPWKQRLVSCIKVENFEEMLSHG
jgi:hypothetical protein